MKKITLIGTGYVGLVTGACLAEMGHRVTCLDIDTEKVDSLKAGKLPFFEPGLEELVIRNTEAQRLFFTDKYSEAIPGCEVCFLALPTPSGEDGSCDISYILMAAAQLAESMDNEIVVVNKSTVPVGTGEKVRTAIKQGLTTRGVEIPFEIVSNPEFLREGSAVTDCMKPDRILLGVDSQKGEAVMKDLYTPFAIDNDPILIMDIASSELAKYASNAMLATRISFMNSLARLCEEVGANIKNVRTAMGTDPRIGPSYLSPGIGFGGSCLPKDVKALVATAEEVGLSLPILDSAIQINQTQQILFFEKILDHFGDLSGKTLAIWGLAFKPDTDDLREAPSLYLIERLLKKGATLKLYDPVAMPKAKVLLNQYEQVHFCQDEYEAAAGANAIILATEWHQFQFADFAQIGVSMKEKILFDGRNQHQKSEMEKLGFDYFCIGIQSKAAPYAHS